MDRRQWLKLGAASLPAIGMPALAGESTGRWDDESRADYSARLMTWLRENFTTRAMELEKHTGTAIELPYDYLAPTTERKKLRMLEKFEDGRLSSRAAEKHISHALAEFEEVRKVLAEHEAKAAGTWENTSESIVVQDGRVYDLSISAGRLTVILDNSYSMQPYLEKLRTEIARDFSEAYFVEVNGCHLDRDPRAPWFYAAPLSGVNPFTPERHIPKVPQWEDRPYSTYIGWTRDAPGAINCMVDLMHTDALYWFCDFDDGDYPRIIKTLGENILKKRVKFYAHTVDRSPPKLISQLAERSGGAVVKKRI